MIELGIKSDIDKLLPKFEALGNKQVPFATSLALNRTANLAKDTLRGTMERIFDRPTPFTLNSLFVKPATKTNLVATVGHKTGSPVNRYVRWEIEGGQRAHTGLENLATSLGVSSGYFLVPARGLALDSYGNVPSGVIRRIASGLRASGGNLFVVKPGDRSRLPAGIYERISGGLRALLVFVSHAHYRAIYDMAGVVSRVLDAEFGRQFAAAMDYALSTATIKL